MRIRIGIRALSIGWVMAGALLIGAGRVRAQAFPMEVTADHGAAGIDLRLVPERMTAFEGRTHVVLDGVPLPGLVPKVATLALHRVKAVTDDTIVARNGIPVARWFEGDLELWAGRIPGDPRSDVFLAFSSHGSRGWIEADGERFDLVALPLAGGDWRGSTSRLVPEDLASRLGAPRRSSSCGASSIPQPYARPLPVQAPEALAPDSPLPLLGCRLALETDTQFFQLFGDVDAAAVYAATLIGAVSSRYEEQVGVVLTLAYLGVHDSGSDPWTTQESGGTVGDLLTEFAAAWGSGQAPVSANVFHFLSGDTFSGSFVGIAYLSALCDQTYGFGVTGFANGDTPFPIAVSSLNSDFGVVAHEIGHNFGAIHTHEYCPPLDQCAPAGFFGPCQTQTVCTNQGTIMSYCHACSGGYANVTTWFHPQSAADMRTSALASCLEPYQPPCVVVEHPPLFPARLHDVGNEPMAVVAAELTGDGHIDLAVANYGQGSASGALSLLAGNGLGNFAPATGLTSGPAAFALAAGDVTGDGRNDLLVASDAAQSVWLLRANAVGGFDAPAPLAAAGVALGVALGKMDANASLDLVVTNYYSNEVSVLLGDGLGGFTLASHMATGAQPIGLAIADIDGSGTQDVVAANYGASTVTILFGNGVGGFISSVSLPTGSNPQGVAVADLNGDGVRDIATANRFSSNVSVLLGTGAGGISAKTDYPTASGSYAISIGDVDGDGIPDIVVPTDSANSLTLLRGTGLGTFGVAEEYEVGTAPRAVALADVDADGNMDAAVACSGSDDVAVLLGDGAGGFSTSPSQQLGDSPVGAALADLDHDGDLDFVTGLYYSGSLGVSLGSGTGEFSLAAVYPSDLQTEGVAVDDLDGDGDPDAVAANTGSNTLSVWRGNGAGSFSSKSTYAVGTGPTFVRTGDINEDGYPDLATCTSSSNTVHLLLNDGAGNFPTASSVGVATNPHTVAVNDVDSDGHVDLVTANFVSSNVYIRWGDGQGQFDTVTVLTMGSNPYAVGVANFNADVQPDIVSANYGSGDVTLALGLGGRQFATATSFPVKGSPIALAIGDLDGDDHLDVVVDDQVTSTLSVLLGTGACGFLPAQHYGTGDQPGHIATGDVNGDGRGDVVTGNFQSDDLTVMLNQLPQVQPTWIDLGYGLAGTNGVPSLSGEGELVEGEFVTITLWFAKPSSPATLFVGLSSTPTPFKGGFLVPVPIALMLPFNTNAIGTIPLPLLWPPGFPPAFSLFLQYAILDAAAVKGVALSNALEGRTP